MLCLIATLLSEFEQCVLQEDKWKDNFWNDWGKVHQRPPDTSELPKVSLWLRKSKPTLNLSWKSIGILFRSRSTKVIICSWEITTCARTAFVLFCNCAMARPESNSMNKSSEMWLQLEGRLTASDRRNCLAQLLWLRTICCGNGERSSDF